MAPALTDRMFKLSLQLAARYAQFVQQGLDVYDRRQAAPEPAASTGAPAAPAATGDVASRAAATTTAAAAGPVSGPGGWAAGLGPEDWASVQSDLMRLGELLGSELPALVASALPPGLGAPLLPHIGQAVAEARAALDEARSRVGAVVTAAVSDKCVAEVKKLRGITATYRMSARPMPTKASIYIAGVLAPLTGFLGDPRVRGLPEAPKRDLAALVAKQVTARFAETAKEMIESARRTEESLRRLKKTRGAAGQGADPAAPATEEGGDTGEAQMVFPWPPACPFLLDDGASPLPSFGFGQAGPAAAAGCPRVCPPAAAGVRGRPGIRPRDGDPHGRRPVAQVAL